MLVCLIVGARPNFMKIAPVARAFQDSNMNYKIVHTGQHYDYNLSKVFFENLSIPEPDFFLEVGSASHAVQTAKVMVEFEKLCLDQNPDLVLVFGDVNSTIACALVASKLGIKVGHVEAGLRYILQTPYFCYLSLYCSFLGAGIFYPDWVPHKEDVH